MNKEEFLNKLEDLIEESEELSILDITGVLQSTMFALFYRSMRRAESSAIKDMIMSAVAKEAGEVH